MDEKEAQSKKPEDSDFQQQRLRAWQPLLTPKWVILTFFLIGVIFLPIGIAILVASRDVVEYSLRYDNDPSLVGCDTAERHMGYNDTYGIARGFNPGISNPHVYQRSEKCKLRLNFEIKNKMKGPVFVYYKLTNFYQNHRRYVKSRSDIQLRGKSGSSVTDTTSCDPLSDIGSLPIYPCGLIANSVFNDTFDGYYTPKGGSEIILGLGGWDPRNPSSDTNLHQKNHNKTWQKAGISWETDRKDKFGYQNITNQDGKTLTTTGPGEFTLPRVDDEDFIVWMRTAGLPTFKKLYRVIHKDFYEGDMISINVSSVFPVSDFSGEKYVVISTTSWLGGKNDFLGIAYIIVGAICLFLAAIFLLKHCISPRPLGDMTYFNWPGQTPIRSKAAPRMAQ